MKIYQDDNHRPSGRWLLWYIMTHHRMSLHVIVTQMILHKLICRYKARRDCKYRRTVSYPFVHIKTYVVCMHLFFTRVWNWSWSEYNNVTFIMESIGLDDDVFSVGSFIVLFTIVYTINQRISNKYNMWIYKAVQSYKTAKALYLRPGCLLIYI